MPYISEISPDGGTSRFDLKDKQAHVILTCTTARSTAAKVVACSGFKLYQGAYVFIRFTDTGTSNPSEGNITLNVNNTGAKTCIIGNSNKTVMSNTYAGELCGNKMHLFVYDGTNWVFIGRDTNTQNSAGASNKASTKMFLVGATSQTNGITTYSNNKCYVGTDNRLYSDNKKCLVEGEGGTDAYVDENTLYLPTDKASVSEGKLIIG